ncbi:Mov34/MPN/PAD-1 family protein [Actinomarinicola tropica]|uniref:Peptidase n=1 Tax=Actinomarinicola tropica TaxID=2789776 RepID=A0A5Q2RPG7_9ACTN|nr:M67 family metallopeptidase [Actinomarinicola tropica]QGG95770.1 peptidase [Actinomarinicola tropica]
MLHLPLHVLDEMVAHAFAGLPEEACGLLVGRADGDEVVRFVPTTNVAASSKVYTVDPREHLRADRVAEAEGLEIIGVMHSHTHTSAYPSPTDVAQAPDPSWHYLIVSLKDPEASTRSYRIVDGNISEETIVPLDR